MTARLFRTAETGLATLRVKAFRHVHDLPVLTQNTERRGALVSRVTSDVDQVSQFLVFGGVIAIVSVGQIVLATVVMLFYSWQLALVVWICFLPLFLSLRYFQKRLSAAYGVVRQQVGALLSAISEPVVGAATVRSYAVQERTQDRIDTAVQRHLTASSRAQALTAFSFSLGGISAGLANAGIVVVGVLLGVAGDLSAGTVLAFAFLVTLFVGPVQMGTQVLTDAQNAFAGWRRVIGILDTPADVSDPEGGVELPDVPLPIHFEHVGYAYTAGRPVLSDVELTLEPHTRVAIVGETGSGKTTLAKILTRLMDPDEGRVAHRRHRPAHGRVLAACAPTSCWCRRRASSSTPRCARTSSTALPVPPTSRCWGPSRTWGSATGWRRCRTGSTARSGSAASRCRPASGSSWRWCARSWPTPTSSCSTRPPAPSTRRWRCGSPPRSTG